MSTQLGGRIEFDWSEEGLVATGEASRPQRERGATFESLVGHEAHADARWSEGGDASHDLRRAVAGDEDGIPYAGFAQGLEGVSDERAAGDADEGLRHAEGVRAKTPTVSGGEDDSLHV